MIAPRQIVILGSTGSVGTQAVEVVGHLKGKVIVQALGARSNRRLLQEQAQLLGVDLVALADEEEALQLAREAPHLTVLKGEKGITELATAKQVDLVLCAISGLDALRPTFAAAEMGKTIALASKEVLVAAGRLLWDKIAISGSTLLPIDSEHSALFQLLEGRAREEVSKLILTASGGPFWKRDSSLLTDISIDEALAHPTWSMGTKISVDSSTLMNKGLEVLEAQVLFDLPLDKIEVVIHPQSVVHSLLACVDGALFAHLSNPDMRLPIQYAITYPDRLISPLADFKFSSYPSLEFSPPDTQKFPALELAYEAGRIGGTMPCWMSAVNEELVGLFLAGQIGWSQIAQQLKKCMQLHQAQPLESLEQVIELDREARRLVNVKVGTRL